MGFKMIIQFNQSKINAVKEIIQSHDFSTFWGFTSKYKAFQDLNLEKDIKISILKKLSSENYRDVPNFNDFWLWCKKNHGMKLATQLARHIFPSDEKNYNWYINSMRNNSLHDGWSHIKARVYKKWCSIITEMQAIYATIEGISELNKNWQVIASSELDSFGIDFILETEFNVLPIQIKKDSFQKIISHKYNNKENLSEYNVNKKASSIIQKELDKNNIDKIVANGIILKYGLPKNGKPCYNYLSHYENGFFYFKNKELVFELEKVIKD